MKVEKMMKYTGYMLWGYIMSALLGFLIKVSWEYIMVNWTFETWNFFDWLIFIPGVLACFTIYMLIVLLGPVIIKKKVKINDEQYKTKPVHK